MIKTKKNIRLLIDYPGYIRDGSNGHRIGTLGQHWPPVCNRQRFPSMRAYIEFTQMQFGTKWYRHYVGFSLYNLTLDGRYHSLDLYWQTPAMLYGPEWIWYYVMDQSDPCDYWRGRILSFNGICDLGVEEPGWKSKL